MEKKNYIRPALRTQHIDIQSPLADSKDFTISGSDADGGGNESKAFTSGGIWGSMTSNDDNAATDEEE